MSARSTSTDTPLGVRLREQIRRSGPIGVDHFMRLALQDPEHGYYRRREPIGRRGDFITAPEVSQMFGELICMWMADLWLRAGRPKPVQVVELGPGRGTMMADILRSARSVAGFREALRPLLVESGQVLAVQQKEVLAGSGARWVRSVPGVPPGAAFWLANEFFDALPIRQCVRTGDRWMERMLGIDPRGGLAWTTGATVQLPSSLARALSAAGEGAIAEWSEDAGQVIRHIANQIADAGGAALIIDYGYLETELAQAGGCDSLQAVRRHRPVRILDGIGEADLSAHVNFSALVRAAVAEGVLASRVVSQGRFLGAIGIRQRAEVLARGGSGATRTAMERAVARLAGANEMGTLFRALALRAKGWPEPAGFGSGMPEGAPL